MSIGLRDYNKVARKIVLVCTLKMKERREIGLILLNLKPLLTPISIQRNPDHVRMPKIDVLKIVEITSEVTCTTFGPMDNG
jgi:hypothetical protein